VSDAEAGRWWERAFGRHYGEVYAHRDDAQAQADISGILPRLRAQRGPVLDVGCGGGRHLRHLRAGGLAALGMDLSPELCARAAACPSLRGTVARADMRAPPVARGWGAVLLLFTSFGYFDDDANAACLAGLSRLLAPGGLLLLDLPDATAIARSLVPTSLRLDARGVEIAERRWWAGKRVLKEVRYRGEIWTESVRIYGREEIAALARACGLVEDAVWASLRGPAAAGERQVHWLRAP
jgi:SAM-dependent methyltransferase